MRIPRNNRRLRALSPPGLTARLAVAVSVVLILLLGVWPNQMLQLADGAAASLAQTASQAVGGE